MRAASFSIALAAASVMTMTGCSLHLHSADNAKRARGALDTYDKIKVDAVVTTARSNMAALSKAQLESRQRVSEVVTRIDLANVIGAEPDNEKPDPPPKFGPGWRKLIDDTDGALAPYGLLDKSRAYTKEGIAASRAIRNRASNKFGLANGRRTYQSFVEEYKAPNPAAGTLDTDCKAVRARVPKSPPPPAPPANEPPDKWSYYTTRMASACWQLEPLEATLQEADAALANDREYSKLNQQITELEGELQASATQADELRKAFEEARKKFTDAQQEAAARTAAGQTAAAKAELEAAQKKLGEAVDAIGKVVEASQKADELVQTEIKTDVLQTILSNAQALSGDPKAAAAEPTKRLLAVVKKYPDIAGRLRAAEVPPVNVLLLELAIQRLHYRRLQILRDAKKDIVAILKSQREARADGAAAWVRVKDNLTLAEDQVDKKLVLFDAFTAAKPIGRQRVAEALVDYAFAKYTTDSSLNALNASLRDRYRAQSLETTELALATWNDLIRAPLSEITAYHEGGITSEELARLINAIGIMAIAVGVYQ